MWSLCDDELKRFFKQCLVCTNMYRDSDILAFNVVERLLNKMYPLLQKYPDHVQTVCPFKIGFLKGCK